MIKLTKKEKLFDIVQLAREIYAHAVASYELRNIAAQDKATAAFVNAEIFLKVQEQYIQENIENEKNT